MDYRDYSATDFAHDSFFIAWVKNADRESEAFWTDFLARNPQCSGAIDEARQLISLLDFNTDELQEQELDRMRNRLLGSLQAGKASALEVPGAPRVIQMHRKVNLTWIRRIAAASIIIPLFLASVFLAIDKFTPAGKVAGASDTLEIEKKVSASGEKSMVFLADGTRIWLNGDTRLSYARDFETKDTRDVYMEGEAFFDVAHNPEKPFIVHTSALKIKVLGTSFNVKSYSNDQTIETTLVHGKVRIEQSERKGNRINDIELAPNQRAIFNKESRSINIKEVVAESTGSWRRERLVFDEERMSSVIIQMEKWYGVDIHVEDRGGLSCKLTASIEKETLDEFLKLLQLTHGVSYSISGRNVFITGSLCER